jgi:hypothetical protein
MSTFSLDRRTFLRGVVGGAAVSIALPWLEVMARDAQAAVAPRRFGVWFFGNGVRRAHWIPTGEGTTWKPGEELLPLEVVRGYVSVLSGFDMKVLPYHPHHSGMAGIMTGDSFFKLGSVRDTIVSTFGHQSIDQVAADALSGQTQFRSLELGICRFRGTDEGTTFEHLSHNGPNNPNPAEYSPARLWNRLFGVPAGVKVNSARKSVLDAIRDQATTLRGKVSAHDRIRLEQHLDSIRAIEQRIDLTSAQCKSPPQAMDIPDQDGKEQIEPQNKLMSDLLALALACDLSRVFTVMWSSCGSGVIVWQAGATNGLHYTCHVEPAPQPIVHQATVFTMQQFAYFLSRLRDTPEAGGNLLDSCAILCTTEHTEGNTHAIDDFPILVAGKAGGKLKSGIHYRSPNNENTSQVLLTVLRAAGVQRSEFGYGLGRVTSTVSAIEA